MGALDRGRAGLIDNQGQHIEIRVLPTTIGAHDGLIGPFTVFAFAKVQSIAYVEQVNGAFYLIHSRLVSRTKRRKP